MKLIKSLIISLIPLLGLSACVATNSTYSNESSNNMYKSPEKQSFASERWFLVKLNNKPYKGPRITLNISTENKVNGFSGCNRYFISSVKVNGNQVQFDSIGSTKKLCMDQDSNQLERRYLSILNSVSYFKKANNRLEMDGNSGNLIFYKKSTR